MKAFDKLRVRVILFLFLFGISPLTFAGIISYAIISKEFTEHIKEELAEIEGKLSKRLETLIYFRWNDTILYSKIPLIKDGADNKKKSAFLKEVLKQYYPYSWLGLTDERGIIVACSNNENIGLDAGNSGWFKKGMYAEPAYAEEPHISQLSDGILVVSFSVPVYSSGGRFKGVLHTETKMDAVVEDIKNIRVGRSGSVLLVR
ncbi:MAG: cache domain-containing protein, partial [Nitrospirae bacterium]|nr:cache domain-containing protein [Nitrospirota bacterium]